MIEASAPRSVEREGRRAWAVEMSISGVRRGVVYFLPDEFEDAIRFSEKVDGTQLRDSESAIAISIMRDFMTAIESSTKSSMYTKNTKLVRAMGRAVEFIAEHA